MTNQRPFISKNVSVILVAVMMLTLCCACAQKADTVDYSQSENWAYYAVGEGKDADLFLICPTVDMGKGGNYNMSMDDADVKESFIGALNMERGIYEDSATMYAPYYRQMTFPVYSMTDEVCGQTVHSVYSKKDLPDYESYDYKDCPYCKQGKRLDALVNSHGYSWL